MAKRKRPEIAPEKPVALITGGAKRVGKAIALKLASHGYDIAFTYKNSRPEAKRLIDELGKMNCRAMGVCVNLTTPSAARRIADQFNASFQRLDVLVHNASIYQPSDMLSVTPDQLSAMFAIHVTTPLLITRELTPLLKRSRGHVITMVDLLAEKPMPSYAGYAATKAALQNLTLSMARQLAPEVTVNGIAPGVVDWPDDMPQADREKYLQRIPLKRAGTPEDVAALVYFLATAGSYITGQIIRLDGGRSLFVDK